MSKPISIEKRFFWGAFFTIIAGFFSVAIFDFSPTQSHYITTRCNPNENLAGSLGSSTAFWCFRFLGVSTFLLPLIFVSFAVSALFPQKRLWWHIFFIIHFIVFLTLTSGWFQVYSNIVVNPQIMTAGIGGVLGQVAIRNFGAPILGKIGCLLLLLMLLVAHLTLYILYLLRYSLGQKCITIIKNTASTLRKFISFVTFRKVSSKEISTQETPSTPTVEPFKPILLPVIEESLSTPETTIHSANVRIFEEKQIDKTDIPLKKRDTNYIFPNIDLLEIDEKNTTNQEDCSAIAHRLIEVLSQFGVTVTPGEIHKGPVITRYEVTPDVGVRVEKIVNLDKNIAMGLAAKSVRIIAPVPGKNCVGIEIPNKNPASVRLREILESQSWANINAAIPIVLGRGVTGEPMIYDLAKMPHLLIAGATGSGKTVCINAIIASLLYHASPENLRFIMVDPKIVEMQNYNRLPHMLVPVVTDPKKVPSALKWLISEMELRYQIFAKAGVRNIANYNDKIRHLPQINDDGYENKKLPYIVCIIDELADLMMVAPGDIETYIARLAQLARAAGIHLILATQRPSVNVITGIIKANLPCRIAFKVSSKVDSRTILDAGGAEALLGQGDMLFSPPGAFGLIRAQGALVSDDEINNIVDFLYDKNGGPKFETTVQNQIENGTDDSSGTDDWEDEMIPKALEIIRTNDHVSTSFLQRKLKIGYNRAARIMDTLREQGLISSNESDSCNRY